MNTHEDYREEESLVVTTALERCRQAYSDMLAQEREDQKEKLRQISREWAVLRHTIRNVFPEELRVAVKFKAVDERSVPECPGHMDAEIGGASLTITYTRSANNYAPMRALAGQNAYPIDSIEEAIGDALALSELLDAMDGV